MLCRVLEGGFRVFEVRSSSAVHARDPLARAMSGAQLVDALNLSTQLHRARFASQGTIHRGTGLTPRRPKSAPKAHLRLEGLTAECPLIASEGFKGLLGVFFARAINSRRLSLA